MKTDHGPGREAVLRLLTEGVKLPLHPLHRLHIEAIAEALLYIWRRIVNEAPEAVAITDEPLLNTAMVNAIKRWLSDDDPMLLRFATLVSGAERGAENQNYRGDRLELRPDISLLLKGHGGAALFPLTVECKIVDAIRMKTVTLYCHQGLRRFVDGDYGWARQEAFMLAYVRDGSTIAEKLTPFLEQSSKKLPDYLLTHRLPTPTGSGADQAESQHCRSFRYPGRAPDDDPGPITIRHIWVNASPVR